MGQVANFAGESAKADAENQARAANRTAAIVDYNTQQADEQNNFVQQTKNENQQGFDSILAARDAEGKARAEAASLGAAGVSVDAVLNSLKGQEGRNLNRIQDAHDADEQDFKNKMDTAYSQAQSRINANQPVQGPSPLGLAINIAGSFAK